MRTFFSRSQTKNLITATLGTGGLGFFLGSCYQNRIENSKKMNPEEISRHLSALVQQNPKQGLKVILGATSGDSPSEQSVRDATIVRSFDHKLTMAGLEIEDRLSEEVKKGELRSKVYGLVYPWTAAGAHVIPFYGDTLVAVHNVRRDKEQKVLRCIEGYMHPTPPKKSLPGEELSPLVDDYKDNAEEEIVKLSFEKKLTRESMQQAYKKQMLQQGDVSSSTTKPDITLNDTAVRELEEEVGVKTKAEDLKFCNLIGRAGFVPVLEANFYIEWKAKQTFKVNEVEIDKAFYIPLTTIKASIGTDGSLSFNTGGYVFESRSAKHFAEAVATRRNDKLSELSEGRFTSEKNFLKHLEDVYGTDGVQRLLGPSPQAQLIAEGLKIKNTIEDPKKKEQFQEKLTKDVMELTALDARAEEFHQKLAQLAILASQHKLPSSRNIDKAFPSSSPTMK